MRIVKMLVILTVIGMVGCDAPSNVAKNETATATEENGAADALRVGFYNVENLFDTKDEPNKPDEEFTPNGKNKWTNERYEKKLNQLSKVIKAMEMPAILGVCEVENETVLKDLVKNAQIKDGNYGVAHRESNDYRGIDNALLYNKDRFEVTEVKNTVLKFPKAITEGRTYTSRDIFQVTGVLDGTTTLHVFVNHFPSRRGGLKASEPKRTFVAAELLKQVAAVKANDKNAQIIIMGDFNDETDNKSITEVLGAISENTAKEDELVNCFADKDARDEGSYNYRGTWNMLDQIIISDNFFDESGLKYQNATIFQQEWMMYNDKRNGATPSRTYGGPNYYGGFSDHLPVFIDLK
ncbi:MAG: hypothetical protein ACPG19_05600 [Saprospiraceae bacterium]